MVLSYLFAFIQLLEECTAKLKLNRAARRVFLADGTEALDAGDIPHDADIYISTGEPFSNPLTKIKGKKKNARVNGLRGTIKNDFHPVFLHGLTKLMFTHLQLSKRIMCLMKEKSTDSHVYCPSLALVLNLI